MKIMCDILFKEDNVELGTALLRLNGYDVVIKRDEEEPEYVYAEATREVDPETVRPIERDDVNDDHCLSCSLSCFVLDEVTDILGDLGSADSAGAVREVHVPFKEDLLH